ncbi:hypothetical protein ABZ916_25880 [Streptomyces sp. NPDC046853]|uniref:hypothetical protein n=1 Tax=Streptomyces sp. NPDC046853 TaxID=3154920 RepID=UPI00340D8764
MNRTYEIREGWNFWPCGCKFVATLKAQMVCGFEGPNSESCPVMKELHDRYAVLVVPIPGDWEAGRRVIHEMGAHLGFTKEQMHRGFPLQQTAGA